MEFDIVKEALQPFPELESPAFIQGILVGLMCGDSEIQETAWIKKLIADAEIKSVKESFLKTLHQLYLETEAGLNGSGFEFEMCLPDDSEALGYRALMLGQWAEGFLYGFGLVGKKQADLEREVSEFINDVGDIARIDVTSLDNLESNDEDESDLMEVTEFIRMGVLLINETLNPTEAAPIMDAQCATTDDCIH